VGIGAALAGARSEAGLSVDQVSERTRIRATIIRAIERDEYAMCGGDFYARGHIRAIARVVGTDPAPLIEQYDVAHSPPPDEPSPPPRAAGGWLHTLDHTPSRGSPAPAAGAEATDHLAANGHGSADWVRPGGISAAEAFRPAMPLQFQGTSRRQVRRAALSLVVLAIIAVIAYLLAAGSSAPGQAAGTHHHPAVGSRNHSVPPRSSPATTAPSPAATPLAIASAAAFGPAGPGQGDNPSLASLAIDGSGSTAWHTDWYATATLNGQPGTGLLLDMGTSVTVSSVQVLLGPAAGGTVQLRAGTAPSLADLPVVAQAANPGGTLTLQPSSPVTARYVLIWFTQLPPDTTGTYEAYVYNVSVSGTG
jgi:transcriptional regulator with XRE-family HTH domain